MEKLVKYDKGTGSTTKDHCDEADDHDNSNASLSNAMTESHSQPKVNWLLSLFTITGIRHCHCDCDCELRISI